MSHNTNTRVQKIMRISTTSSSHLGHYYQAFAATFRVFVLSQNSSDRQARKINPRVTFVRWGAPTT